MVKLYIVSVLMCFAGQGFGSSATDVDEDARTTRSLGGVSIGSRASMRDAEAYEDVIGRYAEIRGKVHKAIKTASTLLGVHEEAQSHLKEDRHRDDMDRVRLLRANLESFTAKYPADIARFLGTNSDRFDADFSRQQYLLLKGDFTAVRGNYTELNRILSEIKKDKEYTKLIGGLARGTAREMRQVAAAAPAPAAAASDSGIDSAKKPLLQADFSSVPSGGSINEGGERGSEPVSGGNSICPQCSVM